MAIEGFISAIVVGLVLGLLGRLLVPGHQRTGELALQVILAVIGVAIVAGASRRSSSRR